MAAAATAGRAWLDLASLKTKREPIRMVYAQAWAWLLAEAGGGDAAVSRRRRG